MHQPHGALAGRDVRVPVGRYGPAGDPRADVLDHGRDHVRRPSLGALSYGISAMLDAYALRLHEAAREGAYFTTAPFVGAAAAVPLSRSCLAELAAMGLMATGVVLLLRERHEHEHTHEPMEHEHVHHHDEHHQHDHAPHDPPGEPHAHAHRHTSQIHSAPDLHHRHPY